MRISFRLKSIANPSIIVRFATLEPKTLPTERPPSPAREATVETESSGSDVVIERRINPAAISDKPRACDIVSTYLIILSLTIIISSNDTAKIGVL